MTLREFGGVVGLYWKTFATVTLAVLLAGVTWLSLTPPQYSASARLLISVQGNSTTNAYQNDGVVIGRVRSYVALMDSDVVTRRVIDRLGLPLTPRELAAKISAVNVPPNTALIDVAVTDPSPQQALRIADTVAAEFAGWANAMESATGTDAQRVRTTVVSAADEPRGRTAERVGLAALIAVMALLLGAIAVWIRSATDPVLRTRQQAVTAMNAPVLAEFDAGPATSHTGFEPFRKLRAEIRRTTGDHGIRVLQISPVDRSRDTASTAMNLGRAMAMGGRRCAVIDASDGGAVWLVSEDRVVTHSADASLPDLRCGSDHVIVATPPVLDGESASATSEYADGVLLIATTGYTARRDAKRAADALRARGAAVVGIALESGRRARSRRER